MPELPELDSRKKIPMAPCQYIHLVTPDELFLHSVRDLARAAVRVEDEYQMLNVAGVLRKTLLDDHPLVHQVNRSPRRKILFEASSEDTPFVAMILEDGPVFWAWLDALSPVLCTGLKPVTERLTLEQLLKKRAAIVQGHSVSIRELILQIANVAGGVHAGTPKTELEKVLVDASAAIRFGGVSAVERTIRGIAADCRRRANSPCRRDQDRT
jgi:hypothetical protein